MGRSSSKSSSKVTTTTTTEQNDKRVLATDQAIALGEGALGDGATLNIDNLSPEALFAFDRVIDLAESAGDFGAEQARLKDEATTGSQQQITNLLIIGAVALVVIIVATKKG